MKKTGYLSDELLIPFAGTSVRLGWFYYVIIVVYITGMVNSSNFTDGIDGLLSSVSIVIALFLIVSGTVSYTHLAPTIETVCGVMNSGGRMAIITFHSLEDRAVKQAYQKLAEGCTCPKNFPVCVCGNKPKIKIITKKPIVPSETELEENPRSRSAKLRIAEKI